ncbi:ATP-binding cassette domain-containing protein [Vibrio brasiliensis]|uniref:Putative ABC transporter ATP-binding protein n=1 Tax=Vibrio brasiliensis LMG 20546 TaxID=945543 RepID=E8LXE5_9VIBR|nr:ATP-binding cassette domain-containing protein [Vibrio brasiliensis]EGA64556.1 putative ABC transporter ATP-binding protein [Vibrio brasiliensis LMG 20546]
MPVIQANKISYQFDSGERLFDDISCSLVATRVGLVGRNGVGKSLFASILTDKVQPSSGSVMLNGTLASYSQLPSQLLSSSITVAQFLGYQEKLDAIQRIASGDCDSKWFDIVGDDWGLEHQLSQQLTELGLPPQVTFPCHLLSGGQLARLQLWKLFNSQFDLLVLDEPSNHLDGAARSWLVEQMARFPGHILLISHDRQLLRHMDQIWELSKLGLVQYGGNYDFYHQQKSTERAALERQIEAVRGEQKRLDVQAQKNREKAQQREAQGNKLRKSGSQSKLILDGMRDSATASVSNRLKNETSRKAMLEQKQQGLSERYEQIKQQKLYLEQGSQGRGKVLNIVAGVLPFGRREPLNLILEGDSKLHLAGGNGCGKSTLLKVLQRQLSLSSGELQINRPVCYLDQHFGLLSPELSMLENMLEHCAGMLDNDARTLLAGIGFRRDSVFRQASQLSGGEKMKLAMLIVSHQPESPLLLLDEPDNHLDLDSKLLLADALRNYQGAFVIVSHDMDFVAESGVTKSYLLESA